MKLIATINTLLIVGLFTSEAFSLGVGVCETDDRYFGESNAESKILQDEEFYNNNNISMADRIEDVDAKEWLTKNETFDLEKPNVNLTNDGDLFSSADELIADKSSFGNVTVESEEVLEAIGVDTLEASSDLAGPIGAVISIGIWADGMINVFNNPNSTWYDKLYVGVSIIPFVNFLMPSRAKKDREIADKRTENIHHSKHPFDTSVHRLVRVDLMRTHWHKYSDNFNTKYLPQVAKKIIEDNVLIFNQRYLTMVKAENKLLDKLLKSIDFELYKSKQFELNKNRQGYGRERAPIISNKIIRTSIGLCVKKSTTEFEDMKLYLNCLNHEMYNPYMRNLLDFMSSSEADDMDKAYIIRKKLAIKSAADRLAAAKIKVMSEMTDKVKSDWKEFYKSEFVKMVHSTLEKRYFSSAWDEFTDNYRQYTPNKKGKYVSKYTPADNSCGTYRKPCSNVRKGYYTYYNFVTDADIRLRGPYNAMIKSKSDESLEAIMSEKIENYLPHFISGKAFPNEDDLNKRIVDLKPIDVASNKYVSWYITLVNLYSNNFDNYMKYNDIDANTTKSVTDYIQRKFSRRDWSPDTKQMWWSWDLIKKLGIRLVKNGSPEVKKHYKNKPAPFSKITSRRNYVEVLTSDLYALKLFFKDQIKNPAFLKRTPTIMMGEALDLMDGGTEISDNYLMYAHPYFGPYPTLETANKVIPLLSDSLKTHTQLITDIPLSNKTKDALSRPDYSSGHDRNRNNTSFHTLSDARSNTYAFGNKSKDDSLLFETEYPTLMIAYEKIRSAQEQLYKTKAGPERDKIADQLGAFFRVFPIKNMVVNSFHNGHNDILFNTPLDYRHNAWLLVDKEQLISDKENYIKLLNDRQNRHSLLTMLPVIVSKTGLPAQRYTDLDLIGAKSVNEKLLKLLNRSSDFRMLPSIGAELTNMGNVARYYFGLVGKTALKEATAISRCYWMETYTGKYTYVPAIEAYGRELTYDQCYSMDSCSGGKGNSYGGCYKWATDSESPGSSWPNH